jgi:two-component system chemotaxis sensor kinase CheA
MTDRVDLREFIGGFVAEANELVAAANASLLEIEAANKEGSSRPKAVRDLFRALHTIKGLAGMIGVEPIVEIAHALETIVRAADRAGGEFRRAAVEVSLRAIRAIGDRVRAVAEEKPVAPAPEQLLQALAATDVASDVPIAPPPMALEWDSRLSAGERQQLFLALRGGSAAWTIVFIPSDEKAARGVTIGTVRAALAASGELVKVAPRAVPATEEMKAGVAFDLLMISSASELELARLAETTPDLVTRVTAFVEPKPALESIEPLDEEDHSAIGRALVRVELSRLDDLQEQLSVLIVSRFRLEREISAHAVLGHDVRRLREIAELQGRQLRDLRRGILRARMVRVAEVFEPLPLLLRSLTRPGVKEVHLEIGARDAELDKAVADRILPAIVHLIRNAVDHAIEPVEERVAAGKPRAGTLRVSCKDVSGNRLELSVTDDGRGIDRADIARRSDRVVDDDKTLLDVLATPGFSTRDVVSRTSGRGVGMEIVRRIVVNDLGGELSVSTEAGVGTTFTLVIPLTIAIIDVFSFGCGSQVFVVPVTTVEEIFELSPDHRIAPPVPGGTKISMSLLARRGHAMPLVSLGALLAIDNGEHARKALVVRRNGEAIAFAVDTMLGRHEVIVRSIDDPLINAPGIAGATDLGDGRPTLLLDLTELGFVARERGVSYA